MHKYIIICVHTHSTGIMILPRYMGRRYLVNSSYSFRYPYRIMTLPLDLSTLTPEELERRDRAKLAAKKRVYVEEEGLEEEDWDQDRYRDLF